MEDVKKNLEKLVKYSKNADFANYSEALEQTEALKNQAEKLDNLVNVSQDIADAVRSIPETKIPALPQFPSVMEVVIKDLEKLKGEKGDKGDKGDQGIQGIQGEQGIQGIQGIQGERGLPGFNGENGEDGETPSIEEIVSAVIKYLEELKGDKRLSLRMFKEGEDVVGKVALHANMMKNMPKSLLEGDQRWGGHGGSGSSTGTFNYENPLTGTLGTDSVYTFADNIGQLVLNSQTMIPGVDYSGQGTTTATFLNGFIPTGTSLVNIYLS